MLKLHQDSTEAELKEMFKEADENKDGSINYSEFEKVMEKNMKYTQEKLQDAFKFFDADGNGTITATEMKEAANILG
jgi:calmodulin